MKTMLRLSLVATALLVCLWAPSPAPASPEASDAAYVDAQVDYGLSALAWAAYSGDTDRIKSLLASGADIEGRDNFDRTALMVAAERGHVGCVKALIDGGASVNARGINGYSALLFAAKSGKTDCVKALAAAGANVNAQGKDGQTALSLAAGYPETVAALQAAGATNAGAPKAAASSDEFAAVPPETILMKAARAGDLDGVRKLIAAGINVNAKSGDGQTPLGWAAAAGNTDLVKLLLDAGANKDEDIRVYTAFTTIWNSTSMTPGETFTGKARHDNYITITVYQPNTGGPIYAYESGVIDQNPLIIAAQNGHADVVKMLLDAGAKTTTDNTLFVGSVGPTGGGGTIPAIVKCDESALVAAQQGEHQDVIDLLTAPSGSTPAPIAQPTPATGQGS